MVRKDLEPLGMARIREYRYVMSRKYNGQGPNSTFWDELEYIIIRSSKRYDWERMKNSDIVNGEVWSQPIGNFYHRCKIHRYTYMHIESKGLVIAEHGPHHEWRYDEKDGQVISFSEWYIFPDGSMEFCPKNGKHRLVNYYGHPFYLISLKIGSNSYHEFE